jgi:hypothetical protein
MKKQDALKLRRGDRRHRFRYSGLVERVTEDGGVLVELLWDDQDRGRGGTGLLPWRVRGRHQNVLHGSKRPSFRSPWALERPVSDRKAAASATYGRV